MREVVFAADVAHDGFGQPCPLDVVETHGPQYGHAVRVEIRQPYRAHTVHDVGLHNAQRFGRLLPRLERKVRVFLQWMVEIGFARDTVQLLTAENARSRRIDELIDSARAAESGHEAAPR